LIVIWKQLMPNAACGMRTKHGWKPERYPDRERSYRRLVSEWQWFGLRYERIWHWPYGFASQFVEECLYLRRAYINPASAFAIGY
jgi:hypothetical protein